MHSGDHERLGSARSLGRRDLLLAAALTTAVFLVYEALLGGLRDSLGNFSKYPLAAEQLARGTLDAERALDFSPLYLRLCAWLNAHAADPFAALVRVQCVCAAAAAGALFLALRRLTGGVAALMGAGAFALYPGLIAHAYVFEPEALMVLGLAATLLLAARPGAPSSLAAGVALALCVLTRPGFWPLVAVIPAARTFGPAARRGRDAGLFVAAFLLVWAGFSFTLAAAPPSPSTMNPGTVLYDGTNPLSEGVRAEYPALVSSLSDDFPGQSDYQHALYRLVARRSATPDMTRGEVNRWWASKALVFALDHPGAWLSSAVRKLFFALHAHRWHDLRVAWLADDAVSRRLTPLPLAAPVAALALTGLVLLPRRWRTAPVAIAGLGLQLATMAAAYASERQRLSLWPFLCFFAGLGLHELLTRRRLKPALAAALLVLPFSTGTDLTRDDRETTAAAGALPDAAREVHALREDGRLAQAAEAHIRALASAPWAFPGSARPERIPASGAALAERAEALLRETGPDTPTTRLHRAMLLVDAGRLDEADSLLADLSAAGARFLRRQRRAPDPDFWLARIAARRGDQGRAVGLLRAALTRRPGDPQALAALAVLTGEPGFAAQLNRYFDAADADYYQGIAALELGKAQLAADRLRAAEARIPESRDVALALAAALFEIGACDEASDRYVGAMKIRPEPIMWEAQILGGLGRCAASAPPDHFLRYLEGRALRQFGRFAEARSALEAAYAASGRETVARELEALEADIAALTSLRHTEKNPVP